MEENQIPMEDIEKYFGINMSQLLNVSELNDEFDSVN